MIARGMLRAGRVMRAPPQCGRPGPNVGGEGSQKAGKSAGEMSSMAQTYMTTCSTTSADYLAMRHVMFTRGFFTKGVFSDAAVSAGIKRIKEKGVLILPVGLCSVVAGAGDVTSQKFLEGKDQVSWQRTAARVTGVGAIYFSFYTPFYRWLATMDKFLPVAAQPFSLPIKVAMDTLFVTPCVFLPYMYTWMGYFHGTRTVSESLEQWRSHVVRDTSASLGIYAPGQAINFSFVPAAYRLPFMGCLDFMWGLTFCYLSQDSDADLPPSSAPSSDFIGTETY